MRSLSLNYLFLYSQTASPRCTSKMKARPQQMMGCQSHSELSSARGAVKWSQCVITLGFIGSGLQSMQTTLLILRPGKFTSETEEEERGRKVWSVINCTILAVNIFKSMSYHWPLKLPRQPLSQNHKTRRESITSIILWNWQMGDVQQNMLGVSWASRGEALLQKTTWTTGAAALLHQDTMGFHWKHDGQSEVE